jgi:predicted aspartyl protease
MTRPAPDLGELYRARRLFELREAVTPTSPPFFRAVVAQAFNNTRAAQPLLVETISAQPRSEFANDAYHLLCQLYARTGQYAQFRATYGEWSRAFPNSLELLWGRENQEKFAGRPDQINSARKAASLPHEDGGFSLPVVVNGIAGEYLFDTGAWQSVVTEPEAVRLGLTLQEGEHFITDPSGTRVAYRTAVAKDVTIGAMRFSDVSFAVYPAPAFAPDAALGVIGIPILIHTGHIKWTKNSVDIGEASSQSTIPNLVFQENRLLVRADFEGRTGLAILDTGASTTDFNANFASAFTELLDRVGKKGKQEISGIGGTQVFESIALPEFTLSIGAKPVALRPATVTLQRNALIGGNCCWANLGRDVLGQAESVSIDFERMALELR